MSRAKAQGKLILADLFIFVRSEKENGGLKQSGECRVIYDDTHVKDVCFFLSLLTVTPLAPLEPPAM